MKQTSLTAFSSAVRPNLTARQMAVLRVLKDFGPMTMHEVAIKLLRPLNTLSGRFSELERKQMIAPSGIERIPGRHPRTVYRAVEWPDILHSHPPPNHPPHGYHLSHGGADTGCQSPGVRGTGGSGGAECAGSMATRGGGGPPTKLPSPSTPHHTAKEGTPVNVVPAPRGQPGGLAAECEEAKP